MRVRNLEQDFSGILYWRLPEDEFMNAKKEVYEAEVSRGKRLRLSIKIESCGAVSTIKFRRCNGNADAGDAEYRSRHGGYRGRGWFR